jgi:hypothetical protein
MSVAIDCRRFKLITLAVFLLSLLFYCFFAASKQISSLANANPFVDDPYDAVGSFGIQLAFGAALISVLRVLRPYPSHQIPAQQYPLIVRTDALSQPSATVTLAADAIALARFPQVWTPFFLGRLLAGLVGGLFLLATLAGWGLARIARAASLRAENRRIVLPAALIPVAGALILAFYPESWRASVPGGISTALVGMLLLMIPTAALSRLWTVQVSEHFEDLFDDVAAVWKAVTGWLRVKVRWLAPLLARLDRIFASHPILAIVGWLNPHRHPARFGWSVSVVLGIGSVIGFGIGEGLPSGLSRMLLVGSVYFSLELAGVITAYVLFGRFLGLYRDERIHPLA